MINLNGLDLSKEQEELKNKLLVVSEKGAIDLSLVKQGIEVCYINPKYHVSAREFIGFKYFYSDSEKVVKNIEGLKKMYPKEVQCEFMDIPKKKKKPKTSEDAKEVEGK